MMHVNFNRLINFLLILLFLMTAGCSGISKSPVSLSDQPIVDTAETDADDYKFQYPQQNGRSHLKFNKEKKNKSSNSVNTVWDRLLSLYSLPDIENERIEREIDWYLEHPTSLAIIQQRAEPYLHHILDEIEAKNIPGELALLPVVESAFVADAYSKADASGLWQFVPSTGEEYGLQQNAWYDGRRDIYASTKAATTYLKELSETFDGDWLLALASYNCGKGRVKRSIEFNQDRNLPTDYWSLDLPQETVDYVPKLLAVAKIFANAEEYNLRLHHIPNKPYFEVVDIKSPLDLRKAAQLANTPYDKFLKLNPGFNRSCTAPQGPHRLLIPVDQASEFKKNLAQLPYHERVDFKQFYRDERASQSQVQIALVNQNARKSIDIKRDEGSFSDRYKVQRGETLASIAEKNHTSVALIRRLNNLVYNGVYTGMVLQMPVSFDNHGNANNRKLVSNQFDTKIPKTNLVQSNQIYQVKKGDTFWNISQRFSVSPKDLADWNKVTLKTALVPGHKLNIKSGNHQQLVSASPSIRLIHYTITDGDSLAKIAKKFNVSADDLRKSNPGLSNKVRAGQKIKLIVDNQPST